ncbi:MAG: HAMP domain-containing histidine kinase [Chloroflexi bacterium]|nr:HAMP domain-containing histidine kinase [Chloroflexota bacterium]
MIATTLVANDLTTEISELRDELRRAQADLRRADESRRRLVDLTSRELRTPITLLLGYARLLENDDAETTKDYARVISNHARQLKNAVDLLITLQRIDAGDLVVRAERLGLAEVIREAVNCRQRELEEKELPIQVEVDDGVIVNADRELLHLMVTQALSYAILRTTPHQLIVVQVSVAASTAIVSVRSRSQGAAAETAAPAPDQGQMANEVACDCDRLGLTLLATKALAELHGGALWLGDPDDGGIDLSFSLPRIDPPAQITPAAGTPYRSQMRTAVF